jgi:hypothetical protein
MQQSDNELAFIGTAFVSLGVIALALVRWSHPSAMIAAPLFTQGLMQNGTT